VVRGAPAWEVFVGRFPTVEALATASPAEVLRAWRGLGYNRRAIDLQRTARIVVDEHAGRFPRDVVSLERLPGVGPYTARAVAAIAFGLPVGAVDTNVRRVLGRVVDGEPGARSARAIQELADGLVPPARAGDWTHALMDLGAIICRSRTPSCQACPVADGCRYVMARRGRSTASAPSRLPTRSGAVAATTFERSNRWLRGRILDRLRDVRDGEWAVFAEPMGQHDRAAVAAALVGLARDGLVELAHREGPPRARLPVA
jgi:A/G-specific adenine glycosylase